MAPPASLLATFACDTPLIPQDLVSRLYEEIIRSGARGAIAASGGDLHPTLGLWSVSLEPLARKRLEAGECSLRGFAKAAGAAVVAFEDPAGTGFFNVNTLDDLAALAARLAGAKG
jgi:molybdopterin-guanine dinucleotide biosynthesis protein A